MRRAKDSGQRTIKAVQLYRSDLQHLVDLAGGGDVEIEHQGMVYDSVPELAQHVKREPLRELRLSIERDKSRSLSIWVSGPRVFIHAWNPEDRLLFPVVDFLLQHTRPLSIPPNGAWGALLVGGGSVVLMALAAGVAHLIAPPAWRATAWTSMVIAGLAFMMLNPLQLGHSKVYLHDLQEKPPFVQRNRDWLIGLASAIGGSLVTVVLTRLLS